MRLVGHGILVCSILGLASIRGYAQAAVSTTSSNASASSDTQLQQKMDAISAALAATQQQIDQSQRQMQQLQQQLMELRQQMAASAGTSSSDSSTVSESAPANAALPSAAPSPDAIAAIQEQQQTIEAAVKQHDQTKVESTSKYPVRVAGLDSCSTHFLQSRSDR